MVDPAHANPGHARTEAIRYSLRGPARLPRAAPSHDNTAETIIKIG